MVLVISQETFNEAVQENIKDFGLTPDEAVAEAIKQFESQGVNLSHIVKEITESGSNSEIINTTVKKLNDVNKTNSAEEVSKELLTIKAECDKGLQFRIFAGKAGAYGAILDTLDRFKNNNSVIRTCLITMISLITKQPDILDERGVQTILELLNKEVDVEIKKLDLKWARECCVMHEMNRQALFDGHILDKLKDLLHEGNSGLLKETLTVCRALLLDDDVRVEFGRAYEHARAIAGESLSTIIGLVDKFQSDEALINDLMLTLSSLLVRAEFCQVVKDAGGIQVIHDVMNNFINSEKINRQCFKLLKALAGNDECKGQIIHKGLAPIICNNLNVHKGHVVTATAGLSCVAALSLRSPENSKALFDAGLPEVIVEIMRTHQDQKNVQKTASWAIRNMVSRSRYQNEKFILLGGEEVLKGSLIKFKDIAFDFKAALRDLGCEVHLTEEWTGKGGLLTSDVINKEKGK